MTALPIAGVRAFGIAGTNAHVVLQACAADGNIAGDPARHAAARESADAVGANARGTSGKCDRRIGAFSLHPTPRSMTCVTRRASGGRTMIIAWPASSAGREDAVDQLDAFPPWRRAAEADARTEDPRERRKGGVRLSGSGLAMDRDGPGAPRRAATRSPNSFRVRRRHQGVHRTGPCSTSSRLPTANPASTGSMSSSRASSRCR